jgi:hypothetical protein
MCSCEHVKKLVWVRGNVHGLKAEAGSLNPANHLL